MNQASESQELSKTLPPIPPERAEIIWEQWKYRHEFFWKAFYVVTVTTAVISTIPLLKTDILSALSCVSLAFPVTGFAFGWFARGLLDAEYKRLGVVGDSFSTSPWSFDTSRVPPYRTDVGRPVGELLRPALRAALILLPLFAALAVAAILVQTAFSPNTLAEPNGPANGSQPIRSETHLTSSAAGSRR